MKLVKMLLWLMLLSSSAWAANAAAFVEGARSPIQEALGQATVARLDNTAAVHSNPAGAYLNDYHQVIEGYTYSAFESQFFGLNGSRVIAPDTTLSLGYFSARLGNIPEAVQTSTDGNGTPIFSQTGRQSSYAGNQLSVGIARQLHSKLVLGSSLRYVQESTFGNRADGYTIDAGGVIIVNDMLQLGGSFQNVFATDHKWNTGHKGKYPKIARAGAQLNLDDERLIVSGELKKKAGRNITAHLGTEYWVSDFLPVRAGWDDRYLTLGTGVYLDNVFINVSYHAFDAAVEEAFYRFSVGYRL